ncbi:MAG TPA: SGNH/GDSL hydrolase family protein [Thermomicrobiales bacterium]|jgi:hypothetical protein|nr:SGNH/GDSL hydrolase family protein [Thermomicrobiales bacterium]
MLTVYAFGDSILDCGHYNPYGANSGQLLVRNDDRLFPDFRGQDLMPRGPTCLEHRAQDGATVRSLPLQAVDIRVHGPVLALVTIGGNDLLGGLIADRGPGVEAFAQALDDFLVSLPIRPILIGNVYDPTFGDDHRNFLSIEPAVARANLGRINAMLAQPATHYGQLVDLHAHFLTGDPS